MKWRILLVFTILGIIGGTWLIFSFMVPPPKGNLQVSVPDSFQVFVDNEAFHSGALFSGSHELEVRYGDAVLVKERVRIQPGDNIKRSYDPKGLLLIAPQGSVFKVQAGSRAYQAKGKQFWLPGFSGSSLVQINGVTLPISVAPGSFTALRYHGGKLLPLTGVYWASIPMNAVVGTSQGSATLPAVLPDKIEFFGTATVDGNLAVVTSSLTSTTPFRIVGGPCELVKITGSNSMIVMTATSASHYNMLHGWRVWTITVPEPVGKWMISDSGFLFVGKRIWSYKDNGAWLWVRSATAETVSVAGDYLVLEKDGAVTFWDFMTGNPTEAPSFGLPTAPEYVLGDSYLYSSDGQWYSGVPVSAFHANDGWVGAVSKSSDIIIWRR